MNVNDRIALEIGRAKLSQIIAEEQLVQVQAQVAERDAKLAFLAQAREQADDLASPATPRGETDETAEGRGGSGSGSDHGGASDAASG